MGPGVVLALGTTRLWFAADAFLFLLVLYRGPRHFKTHPAMLGIAAILLLTVFWTPDPAAAALAAFRVIALYSLLRDFRPNRAFWIGSGIVLAFQLVFMAIQLPVQARPPGLSANASQVGQTGLVFAAGPLGPLAAITLGISTARSAAMGLAIYTFLARTRYAWMVACMAAVIFVAVAHEKTPQRIGLAGIKQGISDRNDLIDGVPSTGQAIVHLLATDCGPVREREWSWHGYGYHGYCLSTGQQRPHNLWVTSWWELGVFSIPFWALVAYGAWKLRGPMTPALFAVGMITEELFSRPEGFYMVAVVIATMAAIRATEKGRAPAMERAPASPLPASK